LTGGFIQFLKDGIPELVDRRSHPVNSFKRAK
jgi:hypothetical protein